MPKNTKGGNKAKRGKNETDFSKREIVLPGEGEAYAFVIAQVGANQVSLRLEDMTMTLGVIRGALRKKSWINRSDLVRVQLRDEPGTVDVVAKYTANEALSLIDKGFVSDAFMAGTSNESLTAGKAGASIITFTNAAAANAVADGAKDKKQKDAANAKANIDVDPMLAALINGGGNQSAGHQKGGKNQESESEEDDDDEDEEGEEGEEGEEEEEEEEEENDDAKYYDDGRNAATEDWKKYHHSAKDAAYKQRNKRAKENKQGAAAGVTAEDVSDI